VDEAVLAKLLLFERVVEPSVFVELATKVNDDPDGRPVFLGPWEAAVASGAELTLPKGWDTPFVRDWLGLEPELAGSDLRGALYVGREQAPLVTGSDKLSAAAVDLLTALTEHPREAPRLKDGLAALQSVEQGLIFDRLLVVARPIQSWGNPPILDACLTMASIDPAWGQKLARFLVERPHSQINAAVVPKIAGQEWTAVVFDAWKQAEDIEGPVKAAIEERSGSGNVAK
jgi:predicted KAP-like P-loop ATPase